MTGSGSFGAIAGGIVAMIAMGLLVAFFATGRQALGRANDAAAAFMGLLLLPVPVNLLGVYPDGGPVMALVTAIGLGAMGVLIVASSLTAIGRLSVAQMTAWQGGSFGGLFLWVAGTSAVIVVWDRLPIGLAWLGLGAAGLVAVALVEIALLARRLGGANELEQLSRPPLFAAVAVVLGLAAFPVWCIWLGFSL
jgi:hypothetical protein